MKLIENIKVQGIEVQDRIKWMAKGNWWFKLYFSAMRERKKVVVIIDLNKRDDNTTIITKDL
jgi:hypothetical protein